MTGYILKYLAMIAILCIPSAYTLKCYYCMDCNKDKPIQVTCDANAASNLNRFLANFVNVKRANIHKSYRCIRVEYSSTDKTKGDLPYNEIRGCTKYGANACKLKLKDEYAHISPKCETCEKDYCNSSGNANAKILLTFLATVFVVVVAHILY